VLNLGLEPGVILIPGVKRREHSAHQDHPEQKVDSTLGYSPW